MNKKCKCVSCGSNNTGLTAIEYLDTMKDYFCYDCGKDFEPSKQ